METLNEQLAALVVKQAKEIEVLKEKVKPIPIQKLGDPYDKSNPFSPFYKN